MRRPRESDQKKIVAARAALVDCLDGVEAAVQDLWPRGLIERASVVETPVFRHLLQNRILLVALSLQRLEGAARRLLKRLGQDTRPFDVALRSSIPVRVAGRLANSWKHGLGGQQKNTTLLNGLLVVHRADGARDASGQERVHVLGMLITDATDGTFASSTLLSLAVRQWGAILGPILPSAPARAERVFPEPRGPVVELPQGVKAVVPEGATVLLDLPEELRAEMTLEAKRRGDST
jgi:hypothetical protein